MAIDLLPLMHTLNGDTMTTKAPELTARERLAYQRSLPPYPIGSINERDVLAAVVRALRKEG